MILRGAAISGARRSLRIEREEPAAPASFSLEPLVSLATARVDEDTISAERLESVPSPTERPVTFEAVAAWLAVQDGDTRSACASILADELTSVHESAKAEGFAAGEEQGRREALQEIVHLKETLARVAHSAEQAYEEQQAALGELCADIVAEAFGKLAGPLLCSREAAGLAVLEVLKRVKEGRELLIRVHPADVDALHSQEAHIAAALAGRTFSIVGDTRVEVGGCVVESKLGGLDGRLDVQMRELFETLRAAKAAQLETL